MIEKVFSDLINFSGTVQDEQRRRKKRGSFNSRYRNNRFFDRTNDGRKFSKNLDRSTDNQGYVRKTNLLDKNGEISKCNVCG